MGIEFVKGIQGDDPKYHKAIACAKHYAVHSGPETQRRGFNVNISPRELYETYLAAFEALVKEGKVGSVMGAYNRVNGEPCGSAESAALAKPCPAEPAWRYAVPLAALRDGYNVIELQAAAALTVTWVELAFSPAAA